MEAAPLLLLHLLVHSCKYGSGLYGIAGGDINAGDGSILRRYNIVLHLHGLQNQDCLSFLNSLSNRSVHLNHLARHGSGYSLQNQLRRRDAAGAGLREQGLLQVRELLRGPELPRERALLLQEREQRELPPELRLR